MPEDSDATSNPHKERLRTPVGAPQHQDQNRSKHGEKRPTEKASEPINKENPDQRTSQESHQAAEEPIAADEASKVDSEERIKLERRRRRCPIVNIEKYLSNEGDEGEKKENEAAGRNRSSLARTIMQEDVAKFLLLVQEGASVWDIDDHGWSPLHWACSRGSTVMTFGILQEMRSSQETGPPRCEETGDAVSDYLNATETLSGWTALHLATIAGKLDVVYLLMEAGCDPQVKDKVGDRPVNCIRRTRNPGWLAKRMRNALLDLSDSEDSSADESVEPSVEQRKKPTAVGAKRPLRRGA